MQFEVKATFTLNDLLAHLRGSTEMQGAYTSGEWAEHFGICKPKMMRLLHEAKAAGALEVGRADRESLDGLVRPMAVYRFVLEDKKG